MKFELEIVKFNADVITTSGGDDCANPALPVPIGNAPATCTGVV